MNSNQLAFTIPLNGKMIKISEKSSQGQRNLQKSREIYLNTLAILAVDFYFQCMEIDTELEKSYGLDSVLASLMNTASLYIKGKGLLECRPVLPKQEYCDIPAEVLSERIGYMVIEIDEDDRQARILGFVESVQNEKLPLTRLKPLQYFLGYLQKLPVEVSSRASANLVKDTVTKVSDRLIKLSQWFEGLFNNEWELSVATARDISPVNVTGQEEVGGAKIIRLMHLSEPVLLIIHQIRLSQDEVEILLRLYPASESIFLLNGVKMELLDDEDNPVPQLVKQAKASNWLQLRFRGNVGDKFSLRISYEDDSVTEKFVI
ncbi:DUF1822 family protein [Scytonema sp. UIC 10036]|uniref:DUF1822 family protein n=1 Tax=Scytonema sp. UIC 10036 TaxID=2304196 RepID=UPI0012DA1A0D|nr:DUF1822 family protein [Scytonema sp. UIC 10036]MUG94102.1 DUF1822 family protein [Scytonema sp. UIC 10036]